MSLQMGLRKTLAGLEISTEDMPGYFVAFVYALIALEIIARSLTIVAAVPKPLLQLGLVALSGIIALVAYEAGSFWDDAFFDPRYRPAPQAGQPEEESEPEGTWLHRPGHPLFLFPNGEDLRKARANAVKALNPAESLYRTAERKLKGRPQWKNIKRPLARSKMARSLILPSLAVAVVCVILAASGTDRVSHMLELALGLIVLGYGLLVVYVRQRVDHLILLYQSASETAPRS